MQHAPREARSAERVPTGPAIAPPVPVEREDRFNRLGDAGSKVCELIIVERVTNDDKTVTLEDPNGSIDIGRVEHLEALDPVVRLQMGPQCFDVALGLNGAGSLRGHAAAVVAWPTRPPGRHHA